jgi:hypothetical protein
VPVALEQPAQLIAAGTESPDHSAVAGRDGYVFLFKGSNEVASLYAEDIASAVVQRRTLAWRSLFQKRWDLLSSLNIVYVQMIIPEKSTVLIDQTPSGLGPLTATLAALEKSIILGADSTHKISAAEGFYRSLVPFLRDQEIIGSEPYLRTESHFSQNGALIVFMDFLSQLANLMPDQAGAISHVLTGLSEVKPYPGRSDPFSGDLADRFLGPALRETCAILNLESLDLAGTEIKCEILSPGKEGGHTGYHAVWRNAKAPLELRVFAFANSFFERGSAPRGLSWWFKHFFSEFHFCWSAELVLEEVDRYHPDVVVCQTVERFLPIVPVT